MEIIRDPSDTTSRKMATYSLGVLARECGDELPSASIAALGQIAKADPDLDLRSLAGRTWERLQKPPKTVG